MKLRPRPPATYQVSNTDDKLVPIGVIGRPKGLRGEVRANILNSDSQTLRAAGQIVLRDSAGREQTRRIRRVQAHANLLLLALEGVERREDAEQLRGAVVLLPRSALPEPETDEYYDADLVGLRARDGAEVPVGRVVAVEHPPAADLLVVRLDDGSFVDLPFREPFVGEVDITAETVEVTIPEDLPRRSRP